MLRSLVAAINQSVGSELRVSRGGSTSSWTAKSLHRLFGDFPVDEPPPESRHGQGAIDIEGAGRQMVEATESVSMQTPGRSRA